MSTQRRLEVDSSSSIHMPFQPAEVRDGEAIKARIKSLDRDIFFNQEVRVWRISPLGIEIIVTTELKLKNGLFVELEIRLGNQKTLLSGLLVDSIVQEQGLLIAHIRLISNPEAKAIDSDRRKNTRWLCSEQFYPTAVASNPAKFNDFIYFKIKDISLGGFKLQTSLRNKYIVPGIVFDCLVNFPMISQINIKLTVSNVRIELENGHETLVVGVKFDAKNEKNIEVIGQYLMQFSSVQSLKDIQEEGFLLTNVSEAIAYSYVRTKEEFEEVLKLRFRTYLDAKKIQSDKTFLDMTDRFDAKSRIVIGKYQGKIICTSRIIFHQVGDSLELEQYIKWPTHLPRPDEIVEIMRVCTHPDFRGSDLLIGMFKYMAVCVGQAKKNWLAISATAEMTPFYENLGFKNVELSYNHPGLNNLPHQTLLANFLDGMAGRTVNPFYWNLVWSDAVNYMSQYEIIDLDPFMQIRLNIYKWFAPFAKYIFKRKLKKRLARKTTSP